MHFKKFCIAISCLYTGTLKCGKSPKIPSDSISKGIWLAINFQNLLGEYPDPRPEPLLVLACFALYTS